MKNELLKLLETHSFKKGDFTLASGKKSSYFLDVKQTALRAEGHLLIGNLFLNKIQDLDYQNKIQGISSIRAVCGVELGGCSLASSVSTLSMYLDHANMNKLNCLYIRKAPKDHGTKKMIEGDNSIFPNMKVVLLEDVTTTGISSLKALQVLRDNDIICNNIFTVVDRLEGAKENLEKNDVELYSLFTIKDF